VNHPGQLTLWQRWVRQPQKIWLRRAIFQAHLWSGIALGLYILFISVTGSVLVYRNELYRAATPEPIHLQGSGPRLTDDQLAAAAGHLYPDHRVTKIVRYPSLDRGVDVWLSRRDKIKKRVFDPWTGADLGNTVPTAVWMVSSLLDLHDNLLAGPKGREVNGLGALALVVVTLTGLVVWWPGIRTYRRSLWVSRGMGWRGLIWHLHSAIGFWSLAFMMVFGLSGFYLAFPEAAQDWADRIEPPTAANAGIRIVDKFTYWLAYLHFGRINGIGIPCHGPGFCDQTTKAVWAIFGLAPAVMFVTGAILWWNRVLRPRLRKV